MKKKVKRRNRKLSSSNRRVHHGKTLASNRPVHTHVADGDLHVGRSSSSFLVGVVLVGILGLYFLGAERLASIESFWSPDCGARFIQVQSIVQHWPDWSISYPAEVLDPGHENSPLIIFEFQNKGKSYIFYSFLFAMISAVFFDGFGYLGLSIAPILGGLGTALAVYGLARQLRFRFPIAPMLLVAVATPVALYSQVFWDHSLTTGIAAISLYLAVRAAKEGRLCLWFAAGAAATSGVWFHEILIPYPVALAVGAIWINRRQAVNPILALVGGSVLIMVPLAVINQSVYGTPFGPHLSNVGLGTTGGMLYYLQYPWDLILGAYFTLFGWSAHNPVGARQLALMLDEPSLPARSDLQTSFVMAVPIILWFVLSAAGVWRRDQGRRLSILLFVAIFMSGVWSCLYPQKAHSLFYVCPFLVLAFAASLRRTNDKHDSLLQFRQMLAVVTAVYTFSVLFKTTLGGTEWGSRYLLATVPALVLLSWSVIENLLPERDARIARNWAGGAKSLLAGISLLLVVSVVLQFQGYRQIESTQRMNRQLTEAVMQSRDEIIITGMWWIAMTAAPAYPHKQILFVRDESHLTPLLQRMQQQEIESFTWLGPSPRNVSPLAIKAGYAPVMKTLTRTTYNLYHLQYVAPQDQSEGG
ncbi:MAG: hypothetical protein ACE5JB_04190 [bacterium]